jgi:hypothetical protein
MPPVPQTKAAPAPNTRTVPALNRYRNPNQSAAFLALGALLAVFIALQSLLPLATAIKIGADEDFELSKAVLLNHGHKLYTEIWSDQPPLYTFVMAQLIQHVSHSILPARLLSVALAAVLLTSVFFLVRRTNGLLPATLATALLIGSPGFLELTSSSMQEIPALAPVIASLSLLHLAPHTKWRAAELASGLLFAIGLQMKLIGIVYSPLFVLILWLRHRAESKPLKTCAFSSLVLGLSAAAAFLSINALTGNPFLLQFQQSWGAHFAAAKSFEYGSPADRPYDWSVLLKNWDTTIPALLGLAILFWIFFRKPPTRSADWQSAVSPIGNRRAPRALPSPPTLLPGSEPREASWSARGKRVTERHAALDSPGATTLVHPS